MKVCCIGGATHDLFLHYNTAQALTVFDEAKQKSFLLIPEGSKVDITALTSSTGGGATNTAVSFARLGNAASIACLCGNDDVRGLVQANLIDEGVSTDHLQTSELYETGRSFIIPTQSGDRTVFAYRGANAHLEYDHIPFAQLKQHDLLYITSLSGQASALLLPIAQFAREYGITCATNPGTSQLKYGLPILEKALMYIDILILNSSEAQQLLTTVLEVHPELLEHTLQDTRPRQEDDPALLQQLLEYNTSSLSILHFMKLMLERGPRVVVVTNGAEGVYAAAQDTLYFHPAIPAHIVNTLGAGDAFSSCFVNSIIHNVPVDEALVHGVVNAASVISCCSAKEGLLTKEALAETMQSYGTRFVQIIPL